MLRFGHALIGEEGGHAAGRRLLARLYRQETGETLPPIEKGSRGKPFFPGSSYHFSITHTRRHAFCALSDRPIGIDAEELERRVSPGLAEKVLSEPEYAQYLSREDRNRARLTFWVLKEAQGKLTGEGIRGFANHTSFRLDDERVTEQFGCLVAVIEQESSEAIRGLPGRIGSEVP